MKITFVLPMFLTSPSGGFKVVYEYANRLAELGHEIAVVHPRTIEPQTGLVEAVKKGFWKPKLRVINRPLVRWFEVSDKVNLILATDLSERNIPDADVIFATASDTAFPVATYSPAKGRKFYLIQSYETWNLSEETVIASWKLPMHKIVVSRQLQQIANGLGESQRTTYIPLGIDVSLFRLLTPINERRELRIGMLAHPNEVKGTRDGLAALELVKTKHPELQVALFGTEPRLEFIPDWVSYDQLPTAERLVEFYNSCRIFLNPGRAEGWGLPAAEAMACGCAVVSADNGGIHEFAVDGQTALIAPTQRPDLMAEQILKLIENDELRQRIASAGHQSIQQINWHRAVDDLNKLLVQ